MGRPKKQKTKTIEAQTESKESTAAQKESKPVKEKKIAKQKQQNTVESNNIEHSQPSINIGLVGHVDHGKTTLTEKLTGKWTDTHSEEQKRGITIRLGYANTTIYQDPSTKTYTISKTLGDETQEIQNISRRQKSDRFLSETTPIRKVSFVDAPGHESLMATMLSGAAIMDAALLLIAGNEKCPQPQTKEHLMALEVMGMKKIIIIQNKIDLLTKEDAINNYNQIKNFLKNTPYKDCPVIPISAKYGTNIEYLLDAIVNYFDIPTRQLNADTIMYVARSFDINKPGTKINDLKGGVIGGAIKQGTLKVGDSIELLPGYPEEINGKKIRKRIVTKVVEMKTDIQSLESASPGGSIAIQTTLDPAIVKSDQLTGNVVGLINKLPPVRDKLHMHVKLFKTIIGNNDEEIAVDAIRASEMLMINVYSAASVGLITSVKKELVKMTLRLPVCAAKDARVSLSRKIGSRFRLIGYGIIQ